LLTEVSSWFILPTKPFCPVFITSIPATSPRYSPLSISSKTTGCSFKSPTISKTLFKKQSTLQNSYKHLLICTKLNTKEKQQLTQWSRVVLEDLILARLVWLWALTEPKGLIQCSLESYTASYQSYGKYFGQQLIK